MRPRTISRPVTNFRFVNADLDFRPLGARSPQTESRVETPSTSRLREDPASAAKASDPTKELIMFTVYGEGRGFRVVWLLEELGLAYRLRPVDLLRVESDPDFLAINPAGFIPVLQDGETIMVESIAILEYLLARHGPSP